MASSQTSSTKSTTRSPNSKPRSLSDVPKPTLSPSPAFREQTRTANDDIGSASPLSPKRPIFPVRGLSLQMPRDSEAPTSNFVAPVPLSPKLDLTMTHGSPGSVLPRRSRGLDFARACTNLHHSTLAESSPDSSPTIAGRGHHFSRRKSLSSNSVLGSPRNVINHMWSTMPHPEKTLPSSSVNSVNCLDTDNSSTTASDEDEDDPMDKDGEDPIFMTPQVSKLSTSNFVSGPATSPGGDWIGNGFSPAAASLMSFQRARLRKGRSRNSSSSGHSSKPSPGAITPPIMKSIEQSNGSHFPQGLTKQQVQSRRESLSLGTGEMHLSDSGEEGKTSDSKEASGATTSASSTHSPRGVVRRPVTRRSNLLPKTKTFARIRAALMEEAAPVENEAKREADVIHQVRESEPTLTSPRRQATSPHDAVGTAEDEDLVTPGGTSAVDGLVNKFSQHAEKFSDGMRFWDTFDERHRTPPPSSAATRKSSSAISEEISSTSTATGHATTSGIGIFTGQSLPGSRSRSRSSTPLAVNAPTAGEAARNANNRKRGRDDDLDPSTFKRRAVSPGMSVQSSPVLAQSPSFHGDKSWGQMPPPKTSVERSNSSGGSSTKRVGLQGMVETNDSLMNMSIE